MDNDEIIRDGRDIRKAEDKGDKKAGKSNNRTADKGDQEDGEVGKIDDGRD